MLTEIRTFHTDTDFSHIQAMIVESDAQTIRALGSLMDELGIQYKRNTSGQHVIRQASIIKPDLLLLDLDLPDDDALVLCRLLRVEPALHDVPIIGLGQQKWSERRAELQAAGFSSYIRKKPLPHQEFSTYLASIMSGYPVWMD